MIEMTQIGLGLSLASAMICVANLAYIIVQKRVEKPTNKLFFSMMSVLLINSLCGVINSCYNYVTITLTALTINKIAKFIYFFTHNMLFSIFLVYALNICGVTLLHNKKRTILASTLFVAIELLIITNPFTEFIYYFDESGIYHRGSGEIIVWIINALYFAGASFIIFYFWTVLTKKRKQTFLLSIIIIMIGALLQWWFKPLRIELLMEAIGFTGILMIVENEDDRLEPYYHVYNRTALESALTVGFKNKSKAEVIIIKVSDIENLIKQTGGSCFIPLFSAMTSYLKSLTPWYNIYVANINAAVIILPETEKQSIKKIIDSVLDRAEHPFTIGKKEIKADVTIIHDTLGEHLKSVSDICYVLDLHSLTHPAGTVIEGNKIDQFTRQLQIEKVVSEGLSNHSFEVYYQPIHNLDKSLHGAEALLRMNDEKLGDIYPDEFIPIAESLGIIDEIDAFVLDEVCSFLQLHVVKEETLDHISINLSVLECIKESFVERVLETVNRYEIPKRFINFEITESVMVDDYDMLSKIINRLKAEGFYFSMDDFGTGYSSMQAAFSLDLDVIKIDKSILWAAEENKVGNIILNNNVHMIKELNKKILVEGVETNEQIDLLKSLGVDYLQGFYFSQAVSRTDFMEMIKKSINKGVA